MARNRPKVTFDVGLALGQGEALHHQADEVQQVENRRQRMTVPLRDIALRTGGNTRPLHLPHVEALAESFTVVGLLQPIVVDRLHRLLAGGHRLAACCFLGVAAGAIPMDQLAAQPFVGIPAERLAASIESLRIKIGPDPLTAAWALHFADGIPIRQLTIDSALADDQAMAQTVEAIENTQRRNYSRAEVLAIADHFRDQGYVETAGRPRSGQKALAPALTVVFGISYNTVRRYLDRLGETTGAVAAPKKVPTGHLSLAQVLAWVAQAPHDDVHLVAAACTQALLGSHTVTASET